MRTRSPIRALKLNPHQFERLRRLLLAILDGDVCVDRVLRGVGTYPWITEAMTLRLFDSMQAIKGLSPYDKKEREMQGYRKKRARGKP